MLLSLYLDRVSYKVGYLKGIIITIELLLFLKTTTGPGAPVLLLQGFGAAGSQQARGQGSLSFRVGREGATV